MARATAEMIEQCLEEFRQDELTEGRLRQTLESLVDGHAKRQDLLYLQALNDYPGSGQFGGTSNQVIGMMLLENGEHADVPDDPEDWPYQTVAEAVRDGWRIIKFPEMALLLNEDRTYGLGCEFILERWG